MMTERSKLLKSLDDLPQAQLTRDIKPVTHLVWLQSYNGTDDAQDYYEVARPGDKCVDGSEPFPVYAAPPELTVRQAWTLNRIVEDLNPAEAFDDRLLRDIHLRLQIHGEKYPERMVSVLHRNVVLWAVSESISAARAGKLEVER